MTTAHKKVAGCLPDPRWCQQPVPTPGSCSLSPWWSPGKPSHWNRAEYYANWYTSVSFFIWV